MNEFLLLNEKICFVQVYFCETSSYNPKQYTYKALREWGLKEGDKAIVCVSGRFKVVDILEVTEPKPDESVVYKWIVQKLDTSAYDNIVEREKQFEDMVKVLKEKNHRKAYLDELHRQVGTENLQAIIDFLKAD